MEEPQEEHVEFASPAAQAEAALTNFVQDMVSISKRSDLEVGNRKVQFVLAGEALYSELPESLNNNDLARLVGIYPKTLYRWGSKGKVNPVRPETRRILIGRDFIARPATRNTTSAIFDRDQIMLTLLRVAHVKVKEFKKTDIEEVLRDPDWSINPDNLNWISHYLLTRPQWKGILEGN